MDPNTSPFVLYLATAAHFWIGLGLVILYILGILLVRWNMIALPSRRLLSGQVRGVRGRMEIEQERIAERTPEESAVFSKVIWLLDQADKLAGETRFLDRIFWSRGQEITGWRLVHEAERLLVQTQSLERVNARLDVALEELSLSSRSDARKLAQTILKRLEAKPDPDLEVRRTLLQEALRIIYDERDVNYAQLLAWHNKGMWMIVGALIFIVALGSIDLRFGLLLLAGAVGGLLSRLARAVRTKDVPTDYGAFWVTLFLSPLMGALAGWAGILLIYMLRQAGVLGDLFASLDLAGLGNLFEPASLFMLGLALLLGFSERYFDQTAETVEHVFGRPIEEAGQPAGSQPVSTPPVGAGEPEPGPDGGAAAPAEPAPDSTPGSGPVTTLPAPSAGPPVDDSQTAVIRKLEPEE